VITHAAALLAAGTAGFLVGGAAGAAAGVVAWTVVLITWWRLRVHNARALPGPAEQPRPSIYADIEDVIDRLDDVARERNWDLGKRFAIACMACENRTMTFDELERRYDLGFRSAPDKIRQDASEGPNNDGSV
jgi:hypothetical protein